MAAKVELLERVAGPACASSCIVTGGLGLFTPSRTPLAHSGVRGRHNLPLAAIMHAEIGGGNRQLEKLWKFFCHFSKWAYEFSLSQESEMWSCVGVQIFVFLRTPDSAQAVTPLVCVGIEPSSYVQHELVNLQLHAGEARGDGVGGAIRCFCTLHALVCAATAPRGPPTLHCEVRKADWTTNMREVERRWTGGAPKNMPLGLLVVRG